MPITPMRHDARELLEASKKAECDLNMGGALAALCESSLFRTRAGARMAHRIVRMVGKHNQQQLRAMDAAERKLVKLLKVAPDTGAPRDG